MANPSLLYTSLDGDRWDNIAWRFYGDATLVSPLLLANCGMRVPFEATLPAGVQIVVPIIQQTNIQTENLPPWRTP